MEAPSKPPPHPQIARAIAVAGGQVALAHRMGISQQRVSGMLNGKLPVTAEMAVAVEKATGGEVWRGDLRPDLWERPAPARATSPAA